MGYTEKVVVIGAGISGLACAYRLKQLGLHPLVLEATERAGGLISTIRRNGFLFETGPQCPRFPASVWRLVRELDLEDQFVAGDPKAKRYIFRHGRLHPAPFSPLGLLTTKLVGLKSKMRVVAEPFGFSRPPSHEESLADFVERKFGDEVLNNLVDPFISTIFFGDAQKMGMESAFPGLVEWERRHGSLVRGAIRARNSKRDNPEPNGFSARARPNDSKSSLRVTDALPALGSFKSGMAALPERLSEKLGSAIRYKMQISSMEQLSGSDEAANSGWRLRLASGEEITSTYVVLAVPACAAGKLLETRAPQLASHLNAIEYAPICAVSSAYERSKVANGLDGFGFMVPRREGLNTICTFWNSSLFRGRAPERAALITSFAGRDASGLAAMAEEDYARTVEAENARILGISGEPLDRMVWRASQALPQYNVGHARRMAEISGMLTSLPNLYLIGNFLKGRAIGDCVDVASQAAQDLHSRFQNQDI